MPAGNHFAAMAGSGFHNLALNFDGSILAWGWNKYGQCDVPAGKDFVAVAAGGYHSLALKSDDLAGAWGWNKYHQFDVPAGKDLVAIARGWWHSLAIVREPAILLLLGFGAVILRGKRSKERQK